MDQPIGVQQGVLVLWGAIALSSLVTLVEKWLGYVGEGEFAAMLAGYALLCMLPYKISTRSNAARYAYVVLLGISVLAMLGGASQMPQLDWIATIVLLPVQVFIAHRLFESEASEWFTAT
jgi:hypothetical protein